MWRNERNIEPSANSATGIKGRQKKWIEEEMKKCRKISGAIDTGTSLER